VPQTSVHGVPLRMSRESDVTKFTPDDWTKHIAAEIEQELARAAELLKNALLR